MKKIIQFSIILIISFHFTSCSESWLDKPESKTIILPDQVWNDESMIRSVIANFYNRLPVFYDLHRSVNMASHDEAIAEGTAVPLRFNNFITYPYNMLSLWNYDLIRDLNLAIDQIKEFSDKLPSQTKEQYIAELRFLRASNYFQLVKRMGGVPIITEQMIYDFSGDPSYLAFPRNSEEEVYDFIASELDEIKDIVGNINSLDRVNKYGVLALKCRAMLYAGSLAKHNNMMSNPIIMSGGEVGIPAARAEVFYQLALDAAEEIINSGEYSLYRENDTHLGENFFEASVVKVGNPEVILRIDYLAGTEKFSWFPYNNIIRVAREDNLRSSGLNPPLNLVEAFEYLDGSEGTLKGVGDGTLASQANWIFYDKLDGIYDNKDARLYGTIIYSGTSFRGIDASIQAGVYEWNGSEYLRYESADFGSLFSDDELLTGFSGPMRTAAEVSNTGFYIRKFMDPSPGSSNRGVGSGVPFPLFGYPEVLLNAVEAAFELGGSENINNAVNWVNEIRERAGFGPNSLDATTLTFEKIINERRVELAYEDHRLWDLIRWRLAHIIWDGSPQSKDANMYALYPYRIVHPGSPNDGKFVFDKFVAPKFQSPRFFRMGNYYSLIPQNVRDNNPKILPNPFH